MTRSSELLACVAVSSMEDAVWNRFGHGWEFWRGSGLIREASADESEFFDAVYEAGFQEAKEKYQESQFDDL